MKNIAILGSTGSIGKNALIVIDELLDKFNIIALTANRNYKLLIEQIERFDPKYVSIGSVEGYDKIKERFPDIKLFLGDAGLREIGKLDETDILLTAVSGAIGIEATIEAIKLGKRIALANKETMVAGGELINKLVKKHGAEIIPVDSEHSAIFQSLKSGTENEVSKLILSASGGPFRGYSKEMLEKVSLEEALKHPNWSMGQKISVDSATLVNKGLEVIEAHYLFNIDYDDIDVVVHPESIIHSLVEYNDNSIIAQLGVADMKLPIQYAFTYPDRVSSKALSKFHFLDYPKLTFEKPDVGVFRGLELAYRAGRTAKSMPIVYNAANEIAVEMFLNKKIEFLDIFEIIEKSMDEHIVVEIETLEDIIRVDREIRDKVMRDNRKK